MKHSALIKHKAINVLEVSHKNLVDTLKFPNHALSVFTYSSKTCMHSCQMCKASNRQIFNKKASKSSKCFIRKLLISNNLVDTLKFPYQALSVFTYTSKTCIHSCQMCKASNRQILNKKVSNRQSASLENY